MHNNKRDNRNIKLSVGQRDCNTINSLNCINSEPGLHIFQSAFPKKTNLHQEAQHGKEA